MSRRCVFTGKKPNVGHLISHSNRKSKRRQFPNLQVRRIWWNEGGRFVVVKLSTRALRSIDKVGLQAFADASGVDLNQF